MSCTVLLPRLFWEFSGRDKNTVQARRASECIVQFQGMHLLAPRACILGVFIKQLGLSGIQATEVSLSSLPIEATKTREEPLPKAFYWRHSNVPLTNSCRLLRLHLSVNEKRLPTFSAAALSILFFEIYLLVSENANQFFQSLLGV